MKNPVNQLVYMMQATEYQIMPYISWLWRTRNLSYVMRRRNLVLTLPAKILLVCCYAVLVLWLVAVLLTMRWPLISVLLAILAFPISAHLMVAPMALGKWLFIAPRERRARQRVSERLKSAHATKIAVAGSYGKTTMKEVLLTVLSQSMRVAATPGNMNVPTSHAQWVNSLQGDEEVLIIEYGEGKSHDVENFARYTHPDIALVTGLAPNHLDGYSSLDDIAQDFLSLKKFVTHENLVFNADSELLNPFCDGVKTFSRDDVMGWRTQVNQSDMHGVSFALKKDDKELLFTSKLIGEHLVPVLACVAVIAMQLGMDTDSIRMGIEKTRPYEHRMQPYQFHGAWVIDDTYNGNIEGMAAGLRFLKGLKAKGRKIYVTPGLVDQGRETEAVHVQLGKLIADSNPDCVVLMNNSVSNIIERSLKDQGFTGGVVVENDPLHFYTTLEHRIAHGDIILMQNDWTDNYN